MPAGVDVAGALLDSFVEQLARFIGLAAVFAAYVGNTMIVPIRVLYAEKEGASLTIISGMATAFLVSNFLFQYPMGWARR